MTAPRTDRAAIAAILTHLVSLGYVITGHDEDSYADVALTPTAVAEWITANLDRCNVRLSMPIPNSHKQCRLFFVLGNDPEEVLCDYAAPTDDLLSELERAERSLTDSWWV